MNRVTTPLLLFGWISAGVAGWSIVAPGEGDKQAAPLAATPDESFKPPSLAAEELPADEEPARMATVVADSAVLATDEQVEEAIPPESPAAEAPPLSFSGHGVGGGNKGVGGGWVVGRSGSGKGAMVKKTVPGPKLTLPKQASPKQVELPAETTVVTSAPPPPMSDSAIDVALRDLPIGSIAFNTPEEIPLGESAVIELLLSMKETESQLAPAVAPSGPVETARVRFSNQMQAELRGLGFEIEPITPELQAVSRSERTRWRWQIMPVETDAQPLHLTLSARVRIDGEGMMRTIETFEREIHVRVPLARRVTDFVSGHSEIVFTFLLAPLAAAGWRWWRRRKPPQISVARPTPSEERKQAA